MARIAPGSVLAALLGLCACRPEPPRVEPIASVALSRGTIERLEALIHSDGAAAADELVDLVVAGPVDLPAGELDRLGRLLIARSDGAALRARLREQAVARPADGNLTAWLERLDAYERSILRGVDINGY